MRNITKIQTNDDWTLNVVFEDGTHRKFDLKPLLDKEAFAVLKDLTAFRKVRNCGYFIEWDNEVDLSADTLFIEGIPIK